MARARLIYLMAVVTLFGSIALMARAQDTSGTSDKLRPPDDMKGLGQRLDRIETTLQKVVDQNAVLALTTLQSELKQLRDAVEQLRREMADMRAGMPPKIASESRKLPETMPGSGAPPSAAVMGNVELANENPVFSMDVLINGQQFTVAPGTMLKLQVPAGTYTYHNRMTDAVARMSTVLAGETKRLTMR